MGQPSSGKGMGMGMEKEMGTEMGMGLSPDGAMSNSVSNIRKDTDSNQALGDVIGDGVEMEIGKEM